jgi:hypothetical protein
MNSIPGLGPRNQLNKTKLPNRNQYQEEEKHMKSELPKKSLFPPSTVRIPQISTKAPNTASNTTSTLELNAPEPPCCIGEGNPPLELGPVGDKLVSESYPDSVFSAGCELLTAAYGVEVTTGNSLRSIGDFEGAIS